MPTFEDVCGDASLYAKWITETFAGDDIARRAAEVMRSAGLVVPGVFAEGLELLPLIDLAGFTAVNSPFASDDESWRRYCRRRYGRADHPSLTPERRNGARASWGGAR